MKENYEHVADCAEAAQEILNKNAGLGLKAVRPAVNQDAIDGIVNRVSSEEQFDAVKWILDAPVKTFAQKIVDESVQGQCGIPPQGGSEAENHPEELPDTAVPGAAGWREPIPIRMSRRMCIGGMITATARSNMIREVQKGRMSGQNSGNMGRIR